MLLVMLAAGGILFFVGPLLPNPREQEAHRRIEFLEIGKKVKACIASLTNHVPQSVEELHKEGVISDEDLRFIQVHRIVYTPPASTATQERVLLTMPWSSKVFYRFQLDGNVTADRGRKDVK